MLPDIGRGGDVDRRAERNSVGYHLHMQRLSAGASVDPKTQAGVGAGIKSVVMM